MPSSAAHISAVLKRLDYDVPDEEAIMKAIKGAYKDLKQQEGLSHEDVFYKTLVAIEPAWAKGLATTKDLHAKD